MTSRFPAIFLACQAAALAAAEPPPLTADGYLVPRADAALAFPQAHGSHPGYRIEWWYLTGHLFAGERRFGMQATFFRLAQRPEAGEPDGEAFGDGQFYLAHMALCDVAGKRFHHQERLNREGWDAWARAGDLDLRNGNWILRRLRGLGAEGGDPGSGAMELRGSAGSEAAFDLVLEPAKPPVLIGEGGLSRKGPEPESVSRYITCSRLLARGEVSLGAENFAVEGEAWMDHEVSSSQLGREQAGWDWAAIQLHDGREVMAYILRKQDGTPDEFSSVIWIDREGGRIQRGADDLEWEAGGHWKSPLTGGVYPLGPRVSATDPESGRRRAFVLRPVMEEQEITGGAGGVSYWEGACDVLGEDGAIVGQAYLELTGYAGGDELGRRLRGE